MTEKSVSMTQPSVQALQGDSWSFRAARALLPILIQCAKDKRTLYYSEAKNLLSTQGISPAANVRYGHPAGLIGDALLKLASQQGVPPYPPLNALVVSKATNLPSVGADPYLARFLGISQAEIKGPRRREHVAAVQKKIFSYPHWDTVLRDLAAAPQPRQN